MPTGDAEAGFLPILWTMRESEFIDRNKDKWASYERALLRGDTDPELLKQLYIHTTDDLAYARTFYPNRSVRVYLNGLAQRTFLQVYRSRRGEAGRFFTFWTDELPRVIYTHRRALLLALGLFVLAMLIGIISYRIDDDFAKTILGESYIRMTETNIAGGDPMAVYKSRDELGMSVYITLNNIFVALMTFVSGVFFALGSVVMLVRTGVMVGVFQYFFVDQGLFAESFLTIWIHGALEISSIVIAGGAGLVLGGGLLFPGTYSRLTALKYSARDALKIMLGTVPLFIIAGFLEGYLTRHTEAPDALRGLFILLCFAFVAWYYVIYPRRVSQTPAPRLRDGRGDDQGREQTIQLRRIRTAGDNLAATYRALRNGSGLLFGGTAAITAIFCLLSFYFFNGDPAGRYFFDSTTLGTFLNADELFTTFARDRKLSYLLLVTLAVYGFFRLAFTLVWRGSDVRLLPATLHSELALLVVSLLVALLFAFGGKITGLLVFLLLPFVITLAYATYSGITGPRDTFRYVYKNLLRSYSDFVILLLLFIPSFYLLDSTMSGLFFGFFDWLVYTDEVTLSNANRVLETIIYFFTFGLLFVAWAVALTLNFYTLHEIERADGLLEEVERFGEQRRLRGMELES